MLGILYIFGSWRCAVGLRDLSPHWLCFALALNWIGDMAAYYAGRTFGRHKLAPKLSPKKTWEGSIASIAAAAALGVLYLHYALPERPVWELLLISALANVAGQVGDLAESAIKRGADVKDSGTLLPGHGGFLDRVDGTLFTLPVVYLWLLRPWTS